MTGSSHPVGGGRMTVRGMPAYDRGPLYRRATSWMKFMARAAPSLALQDGKPFLVAVSNPPLNAQLALALSRTRGMPYGLLIWDIYPDALVRLGWLRQNSPVVRAWRRFNAMAMLEARVVVTLGERMRRVLAEQVGSAADRVRWEVIPNWVDTSVFRPREGHENPFACEQGWIDGTTVLYSGNIGAGHGVEMLPAAARLLSENRDIRFAVVGDGLGRPALEREVAVRNPPRFTLHPYQPWDRVPEVVATGNIAVVFQRPGFEDLAMPSKTYSALASGSAILAVTSDNSDLAALVRDHDVGIVVSANPTAISEGLKQLVTNPRALQKMRCRARAVAVAHFDTQVIRRRWETVLSPLIHGSHG
ncbi:MAG: glycosyltransferase family 4 protein [Deltaproteobacteria bacterium]|nr:glycosyltransferase family 4 protein [Deltaproteobacteria bacterium]